MATMLRRAIVNKCGSCGYRETRLPPAPASCPKCGAGLKTDPNKSSETQTLRTIDGTGSWKFAAGAL